MAIFEIGPDRFREIEPTTFSSVGIREKTDLQRLLREQIEIVSPETLVIAEEFGEWEDAKRRIDLLGVDKNANLVVIELKRTEDGGHMELQAIRYAAMISTMTFDKVVEVFGDYLKKVGRDGDSRAKLLEFLEWDEPNDEEFGQDVRIVLASAEFSKEITTAVLWLNDHGLDIRCIRIKPYRDHERILMDVQQVIPLPEATEYMTQIGKKKQEERVARQSSKDYTKYNVTINGERHDYLPKRHAVFLVVKHLCHNGVSPEAIAAASGLTRTLFQVAEGCLGSKDFVAGQTLKKEGFDESRWRCDEGELIQFGGKTYAFTSQWGHRTKEVIDRLISAFPDKQISFAPSS